MAVTLCMHMRAAATACCLMLFCPCVAFGRTTRIVDKGATCIMAIGSIYNAYYRDNKVTIATILVYGWHVNMERMGKGAATTSPQMYPGMTR
ncbi:cell number regulator 2-like [Phragmites australis]|uniref:cell number regulator 2-like n=1 Tax=Phragmites australis TaxID=29695 RepID=UPI002D778B1A|nr:cell number regulator 2-like [Phragmites australis]